MAKKQQTSRQFFHTRQAYKIEELTESNSTHFLTLFFSLVFSPQPPAFSWVRTRVLVRQEGALRALTCVFLRSATDQHWEYWPRTTLTVLCGGRNSVSAVPEEYARGGSGVAADENGYRDKVIPTCGEKCGLNADRAHGQQVEFIRRASTSTIQSHGRL